MIRYPIGFNRILGPDGRPYSRKTKILGMRDGIVQNLQIRAGRATDADIADIGDLITGNHHIAEGLFSRIARIDTDAPACRLGRPNVFINRIIFNGQIPDDTMNHQGNARALAVQ